MTSSFVRVGGSLLLLGIIFWVIDLDVLLLAFRRVELWLWALTIALHVSLHGLQAAKWSLFVRISGVRIPFGLAARAHAAGLFSSLGLPSLIGGDVLRAAIATRQVGHPEAVVFGSLVDRLTDILGILIVVGIAFVLAPSAIMPEAPDMGLVVVGTLLALGVVGALGLAFLYRPPIIRRLPRKLARTALRIRRAGRTMLRNPGAALLGLALSVVFQAGIVATAIPIGEMIGFHMDPRLWFLCYPLAKVATMAPISLGGLGVLEVTFGLLVSPFADSELAVALALIMQSIRIALGLVAGLLWFGAGWLQPSDADELPGT